MSSLYPSYLVSLSLNKKETGKIKDSLYVRDMIQAQPWEESFVIKSLAQPTSASLVQAICNRLCPIV